MNADRNDSRPIGVFDSGIGGLTVAAAIRNILPDEEIIYLGDLLHLPYGTKSPRAVLEFTRAAVGFLIDQGVKLLVIACNTATSVAMGQIEAEVEVPVIGVIEPGAVAASAVSRNRRVGIIGTARTIESNAYPTAIKSIDAGVSVFQKATPLLVPLIEEGWMGHPVLKMVLSEYFRFFSGTMIDTVVLGCTHYPLVKRDIQEVMEGVEIVDSARTTAESTRNLLEKTNALNRNGSKGTYRIFLTDYTDTFRVIGERMIGREHFNAKLVTLGYSDGRVFYFHR